MTHHESAVRQCFRPIRHRLQARLPAVNMRQDVRMCNLTLQSQESCQKRPPKHKQRRLLRASIHSSLGRTRPPTRLGRGRPEHTSNLHRSKSTKKSQATVDCLWVYVPQHARLHPCAQLAHLCDVPRAVIALPEVTRNAHCPVVLQVLPYSHKQSVKTRPHISQATAVRVRIYPQSSSSETASCSCRNSRHNPTRAGHQATQYPASASAITGSLSEIATHQCATQL